MISSHAMASRGRLPFAYNVILISMLLTLCLDLPTTWGRIFSHQGDAKGGPFSNTVYYPWALQQEDQGCVAASMATLLSPSRNYSLKLNVVCPDHTMDPWNVSFVAGVGRQFPDQFQADGTSEFPLRDWTWTIPVGLHQPTNSCALRFTESGDLEFVVPNLKRGHDPSPPWQLERVLWTTNTSGMGAVDVQIQDSGNLVLVHSDGKTVVWQALNVPLLPLEPLSAAARPSWSPVYLDLALAATVVAALSTSNSFFLHVV